MKKYRNKAFRVLSAVLMSVIMIGSLMACGSEEKENNASVAVTETDNPR